jgi:hypothetical protein
MPAPGDRITSSIRLVRPAGCERFACIAVLALGCSSSTAPPADGGDRDSAVHADASDVLKPRDASVDRVRPIDATHSNDVLSPPPHDASDGGINPRHDAPIAETGSADAPPSDCGTPQGDAGGLIWLIDAPSLNGLLGYAATQDGGVELVRSVLDHPTTYVMVGSSDLPIVSPESTAIPACWTVTRAIITSNLFGVAECAAKKEACVLDLEGPPGNATRLDGGTITHPGPTFASARVILDAGETLIAFPGENLAIYMEEAMGHDAGQNTRFDDFLQLDVPAAVSPHVDFYGVQAQELEEQAVEGFTYASFVDAAASEARQGQPGIKILSALRSVGQGLDGSTIPDTPAQLFAAAKSVKGAVDGYWLGVLIMPYPWKRTTPYYDVPFGFLQQWAAQ